MLKIGVKSRMFDLEEYFLSESSSFVNSAVVVSSPVVTYRGNILPWAVLLINHLIIYQGDYGCKELNYLDCIKHKTITSHVIKVFTVFVPGLEDCQHKCFLEDKCVSYNLGPVNGMIRTCELNDADHVSDPGHVVSKEDFEYCPIKNPCSSNPCSPSQWCEPDFYWNTFKCIDGKWTQWGQWTCECPHRRFRACTDRLNTSLASTTCGGSDIEGPKECRSTINITDCSRPLGIGDGSIPDAQIIASSFHSAPYQPFKARLKKTSYWCPASVAVGTEYLQIDLGSIKWVTKVATQGASNPLSSEWVQNYTLSFANDTSLWKDYKPDQNCTKKFSGNIDRNTVVTRELPVPVKTRHVKIIVQEWSNYICMRAELYGCTSL